MKIIWRNLKTLRCAAPDCRKEFKQRGPGHRFCSKTCQLKDNRPMAPHVFNAVAEFRKFCHKHELSFRFLVPEITTHLQNLKGKHNETQKLKIARLCSHAKKKSWRGNIGVAEASFKLSSLTIRRGNPFAPWSTFTAAALFCRTLVRGDTPNVFTTKASGKIF